MIEYWLALVIVLIAFIYDVTTFKIPNWISIIGVICGVSIHLIEDGWSGIIDAGIAIVVGFVPMLIIYLLKGIGAGDVKLFGALATMIGASNIYELMIISFLIAGVISILLIGYQGIRKIKTKQRFVYSHYLKEVESDRKLSLLGITKVHQFPFMLAVAPAMVVQFLIL